MDILQKIIANKKETVKERKDLYPTRLLEKSIYFDSPTVSMRQYLKRSDLSGIIAEFKRKSPSKGMINAYAQVEKVSIGYMQAGASALSVLTDEAFFGGPNADLTTARKFNFCPILRKDFIIDEYQIIEARSIGADAILLIAAALTPKETERLARFAQSMRLEVLLEVHSLEELKSHANPFVDLLGVNNRDLKSFDVKLELSLDLASQIPSSFTKISESGIRTPKDVIVLKRHGYEGFLIGENFMRHSRPEDACSIFIEKIKNHTSSNKMR